MTVKRGFDYFIEPTVDFTGVVGRELHKDFLINFVQNNSEGKFLFYGPKGTSKSFMAEALAGQLGYNYLKISASELQEGIVGEGTKKIKEMIRNAKLASPCVLHLDEINGIYTQRGTISHKQDESSYLDSVLARPFGSRVYLVATTNNPLEINPTSISRYPNRLFFELPEGAERKKFLEQISIDPQKYADACKNYSFRDLEQVAEILKTVKQKHTNIPGSVFEAVFHRTPPENADETTNWQKVQKVIGDRLEIERIADALIENGEKKNKS